MKTIKYYRPHGGQVVRTDDETATQEVNAGKAMYCPKRLWKAQKEKQLPTSED